VAVDELLKLLPRSVANVSRDVPIGTSVELGGAVVTVEPVNAHVLDWEVAALAAAGRPGNNDHPRSGHEN
jgi:hypothetical protein